MYWVGKNTRQGYRQVSIRIFPIAFWQSKSFGRVCVACLCTQYYTISNVIECEINRTIYGGFESPCLSGKENRAMRHWHSFLMLISMAFHGKSCYSAQWALRSVTMARIYSEKNWKDPVYLTKHLIFAKGKCIVIKWASAAAAAEYGQIRIAINVLFLYFHFSHSQNQNRWNGSKRHIVQDVAQCCDINSNTHAHMRWANAKNARTHMRDNIYQFEVLCFEWNLHEIISLTKEILWVCRVSVRVWEWAT